MQSLNGLGDNTEVFIEFSHQDDARQDRHIQVLRDYNQNHKFQQKADHWASYPKVQEAKEK